MIPVDIPTVPTADETSKIISSTLNSGWRAHIAIVAMIAKLKLIENTLKVEEKFLEQFEGLIKQARNDLDINIDYLYVPIGNAENFIDFIRKVINGTFVYEANNNTKIKKYFNLYFLFFYYFVKILLVKSFYFLWRRNFYG